MNIQRISLEITEHSAKGTWVKRGAIKIQECQNQYWKNVDSEMIIQANCCRDDLVNQIRQLFEFWCVLRSLSPEEKSNKPNLMRLPGAIMWLCLIENQLGECLLLDSETVWRNKVKRHKLDELQGPTGTWIKNQGADG